MAEAFARRDGSDVIVAASAGVAPCGEVSPVTKRLMAERGVRLDDARSKGLEEAGSDFDIAVNMSGWTLPPGVAHELRKWRVADPVSLTEERHREVRDHIEALVAELVEELRRHRDLGGRRHLPQARDGI
jgi:protein-tyrosine-phosphatase